MVIRGFHRCAVTYEEQDLFKTRQTSCTPSDDKQKKKREDCHRRRLSHVLDALTARVHTGANVKRPLVDLEVQSI